MENCQTQAKNMKLETCRVCLGKSRGMLNIFQGQLETGMSIADLLWEATGYPVTSGDPYPKTICQPCLQDGQNALEIKQTYARSHQFFCQFQKNLQGYEDTPELKIKDEGLSPTRNQFECQVMNELIEEDTFDSSDVNRVFMDQGSLFKVEISENELLEDSETKIINDKVSFKCLQCQKTFAKNRYLKMHIKRHLGDRPFLCLHCQKSYSAKEDLQTHLLKHTFECAHCQRRFLKQEGLAGHMRTHTARLYKCSHCPKSFTGKTYLNVHMKTEHVNIHTKERPFECSHCQQTFSIKESLKRHLRTHTGERPYRCSHCSSSFAGKSTLDRHLKTHTGERPYKCSYCERTFPAKATLTFHMTTHTGERPYKCSQCTKTLSSPSNLKIHMAIHMGIQHKCSKCPKSFSTVRYLKQHLRTHKGERVH